MERSLKIPKRGRTYNAFVTNESLEDYSLRYASKSFRKWTGWLLANTALGGISFLALEAIGALLIVKYGSVISVRHLSYPHLARISALQTAVRMP